MPLLYAIRYTLYAKKGFTLIELLVVITILGILATLVVASFASAQQKARDVRRKADFDAIKKALQLYYNDNGKYPDTTSDTGCAPYDTSGDGSFLSVLQPNYIKKVPVDPINSNPGGCLNPEDYPQYHTYQYQYVNNGQCYILNVTFENQSDPQVLKNKPNSERWFCGLDRTSTTNPNWNDQYVVQAP